MKVIKRSGEVYVLQFERGEEVIGGLKSFCEKEEVKAGQVSMIGAAGRVELGFYYLDKKDYDKVLIDEMVEVASAQGNIAVDEKGELIIHVHGVFSTSEKVWAGHVFSLEVGVTCEVVVRKLEGEMRREMDEGIGLKLLNFD